MTCEAWPITWPIDISDTDETLVEVARQAAQGYLAGVLGGRVGPCHRVEEYQPTCGGECGLPRPYLVDGYWINTWAGDGSQCCRINLVGQPVKSVEQVTVGGTIVDPSAYRLDGNDLLRLNQCWGCPAECDPALVVVAYTHGIDPPPMTQFAMGEVAVEYLELLSDGACRLPTAGRRSVSRNGVSIELADPTELVKIRRTGLPLADALIQAVNPAGLIARSRVYSPDMAAPR